MSKELTEQQLGKELYQKHKEIFRVELANGTLPHITNYPPPTLCNVQIGIAYEALKEEDYETASAFFLRLGEEYDKLAIYVDEMARRNPGKEEKSNLVEKINGILNHKTRHEFARKRIELLAEKHIPISQAKEGELLLTDRLNVLEEEYTALCKISRKQKIRCKDQLEDYAKRFFETLGVLGEFYAIENEEINLDFKNKISSQQRADRYFGGGVGMGMSGTLASFVVGIITANPICILSAAFSVVVAMGLMAYGVGIMPEKGITKVFEETKKKSAEVDQLIQSAYMPNFYQKKPEVFKQRFMEMDASEQKLVIGELLKVPQNKEVDKWLDEDYKNLIEDEGLWRQVH